MRVWTSPLIPAILGVFFATAPLHATSLAEIESAPRLTPESFARYFRDFSFKFHDEVQPADVFLATRSGDCDDYSILAARLLRPRGYTPRLIAVRMPGIVHVVCYIEEAGAYLDYNARAADPLVKSSSRLSEIARSVARSYGAQWTSASEFTSDGTVKRLVQTVQRSHSQIAAILP